MFTEYISTETLFTKELEIELKSGIADKSYYIRQKEWGWADMLGLHTDQCAVFEADRLYLDW
jgi:hypothetical protein